MSTWSLLSEHLEQIEHLSTPNLSNDMKVSTEAHSITIPLETLHEPQASVLQCLKEPSYDKLVKDLCTQGQKSRNHFSKKIIRSKQVGYLRWRNILLEGYQILKKKGWKRLVGQLNDQGKHYKISSSSSFFFFFFFFFFPHIFFHSFFILFLVILFLTAIKRILVFKFGGRSSLFHTLIFFFFFTSGNVFLYYTLSAMCNSSLGV
jgi:hypothetical protein